jgi:predicted RNase H-like HicB family nuclease
MIAQCSAGDQLFMVKISDFTDLVVTPCNHGKACEEEIYKGEEIIAMYVQSWQKEGESILASKTLQTA